MCWEQAIRVCAKLRQRFETQTYDYTMLGKFLLHHEAELFSQIVAGQSATHQRRLFPNYFFVTFHGPDFPQVCVSFCFGIVFGVALSIPSCGFGMCSCQRRVLCCGARCGRRVVYSCARLTVYISCALSQKLRGNRYIYRGGQLEHITVFVKRLLTKWPFARQALPNEDISADSATNGACVQTWFACVHFSCPSGLGSLVVW